MTVIVTFVAVGLYLLGIATGWFLRKEFEEFRVTDEDRGLRDPSSPGEQEADPQPTHGPYRYR
jgi:hypothetical protein